MTGPRSSEQIIADIVTPRLVAALQGKTTIGEIGRSILQFNINLQLISRNLVVFALLCNEVEMLTGVNIIDSLACYYLLQSIPPGGISLQELVTPYIHDFQNRIRIGRIITFLIGQGFIIRLGDWVERSRAGNEQLI